MEDGLCGIHGVPVRQLVESEIKFVHEIAIIHQQVMVVVIVKVVIAKVTLALFNLVLVWISFTLVGNFFYNNCLFKSMVDGQIGHRGQLAAKRVVKARNTEDESATHQNQ